MTPREIKVLLVMRGVNLADVARELGVNPSLVSAVARKEKRSLRVEKRLAELLGSPIDELFGVPAWRCGSKEVHVATLIDISKAG